MGLRLSCCCWRALLAGACSCLHRGPLMQHRWRLGGEVGLTCCRTGFMLTCRSRRRCTTRLSGLVALRIPRVVRLTKHLQTLLSLWCGSSSSPDTKTTGRALQPVSKRCDSSMAALPFMSFRGCLPCASGNSTSFEGAHRGKHQHRPHIRGLLPTACLYVLCQHWLSSEHSSSSEVSARQPHKDSLCCHAAQILLNYSRTYWLSSG